MVWKLTWVALGAFCLAGCGQSRVAGILPAIGGRDAFDTRDAPGDAGDVCMMTMERLRSERLPTLRSVEPWQSRYGPGLKLTTDHYEVFTTVLEPLMLRTVPGFLESAYWGYNDQLIRPIETVTKFTVYLFATRNQWEEFTRGFAGDQAAIFCRIKTGAYCLNGACVAYDLGGSRTLAALGHEGWHQFNSRHFKYRLPSWLDEGIAMLFETSRYHDGMYDFDPTRNVQRLGALRETLDKNGQIPLGELIAMSPGEVLATDQADAVMAFYSQSYALVRFLREGGHGKRLSRYHRMVWDALSGEWPLDEPTCRIAEDRNLPRTLDWNRQVGAQVFTHYIAADADQVEREYLAYCQRLVHDVLIVWRNDQACIAIGR